MERCTKELFHLPKYKGDVRYLRIWIQYADLCNDPTDIFKFLESNEIGQGCSLFYEAYATFLEFRGKYNSADQIYQKGIAMKAQPADKLRKKFEAFQNRMAKRIQNRMQDGEDLNLQEEEGLRNFGLQHGTVQHPRGIQRPETNENLRPANGETLDVFADDDLDHGQAEDGGNVGSSLRWPKFEGTREIRKENVQTPATWDSVSLPAKNTSTTASAFEMYQDPDLLAQERERELYKYRENKAHGCFPQSDKIPGSDKTSVLESKCKQPRVESVQKRTEIVRFDTDFLMDENGVELCLEELRVKEMGISTGTKGMGTISAIDVPEGSGDCRAKIDSRQTVGNSDSFRPESEDSPLARKEGQEKQSDSSRKPVLDFGEQVSPPSRFGTVADQTINTKEAFEDIMSMFNDTLPIQKMGKLHQALDGPDKEVDPWESAANAAHKFPGDGAANQSAPNASAAPNVPESFDGGLSAGQDTSASPSFLDIREDTVFLQSEPEGASTSPLRTCPQPAKAPQAEETVVLGKSWADPTSSEATVPLERAWDVDDAPTVCLPASPPSNESPRAKANWEA